MDLTSYWKVKYEFIFFMTSWMIQDVDFRLESQEVPCWYEDFLLTSLCPPLKFSETRKGKWLIGTAPLRMNAWMNPVEEHNIRILPSNVFSEIQKNIII